MHGRYTRRPAGQQARIKRSAARADTSPMRRALAWTLPALAAAALAPLVRGDGGDGWIFVAAGRTLLSPHWSHAFADPSLQVGPLQLALFGSVGRSPVALAVLLGVVAALLPVAAARALGVERPALLAAVGLLAVAAGFTITGYDSGHPADSLLPLLWVLAAVDARRGRTLRAGLVVGLCAGIETWGILGVAVLALAPRRREAARGLVLAAGVAAGLFLPVAAAGNLATGSYSWTVAAHAPLALVLPAGTSVGWPFRLVQGALALGVGLAAARIGRRTAHALWLVPFAVVAARLLLDPLGSGYYVPGLEGPALAGAALLAARGLPLRGLRREALA
jgi:hypothetical protein